MLEARDLHFSYRGGRTVLSGVSVTVQSGEVVGLSGASGCGKSTLGRLLAGYLRPDSGTIEVEGGGNADWSPVQHVHQSGIFAVDPRWRIGRVIEEGWVPDAATREALGVSRGWYDRFPHEISGGELQRVTLLRALAPATRYLVADELTAMLDPLTQAEIWRFLLDRCRDGLGIVAISHDAPLLRRVASTRLVLTQGKLGVAPSCQGVA